MNISKKQGLSRQQWLVMSSFVLAILILPLVVLMTLREAARVEMKKHAQEISTAITDLRRYYNDNVIAPLQQSGGKAVPSDDFRNVHGGIPIPATFSIEIGKIFNQSHEDTSLGYAFVSDYPFTSRKREPLDAFQQRALEVFRSQPNLTVLRGTRRH